MYFFVISHFGFFYYNCSRIYQSFTSQKQQLFGVMIGCGDNISNVKFVADIYRYIYKRNEFKIQVILITDF